jgi:two-component system, NtrC family, nitrogen regulation response regulator NtrX
MKNNLRILLVDDVEDLLDIISELLEMDGYEVKCATNYYDALAALDEREFDLVITDYCMPKMNGLYLLEMIKDKQPNMPVIIISGVMNEEAKISAKRRGVDMILFKPFPYEQLDAAIRKMKRKLQR